MIFETAFKERLNQLQQQKNKIIIAIDGRCASGKTTLASRLGMELNANIIHMDDFFLRPEQRTKERMQEPGGNVDRERFLEEVLLPIQSDSSISFRPYNCHTGGFKDKITLSPKNISIVEGSYSCHPALWNYYDLHIFMSVSKEEQIKRIRTRNASSLIHFQQKWIPYEEYYFTFYHIMEKCELIKNT